MQLIHSFPELFNDARSQTTVLCHDIDVAGAKPIKQHANRVNLLKQRVIQEEVYYLLEHGLAIPSNSPWSTPCLLVPKPDGTFRFCMDYRKINSVTVSDAYSMPRLGDSVDCVGSATFVSKLDMLKGYWQIQ